MKKIRYGIIGCGKIASSSHVPALLALQDQGILEVTATCDVALDRAETASALFGNTAKAFTNYCDMLDYVDAVSVALPHDLHYECGMFFAINKKHILMEKPLCNTEEECKRLIAECDKQGRILMCEYPVRFTEGVLKLKEAIDSGKYGKPYHLSIWTEQWTDCSTSPWATTSRLGGGQLFSHGCHFTDALLWILGEPLYGTHVGTNLGTPWMIREGTSTLSLKFKSGATAMHFATWGTKGSKMNYDYQVFMDSGVMLNYEYKANELRLYYNEDFPSLERIYQRGAKGYTVLWKDNKIVKKALPGVIKEFVECIQTGREPITSGRRALESLRMIWKVYKAEENRVVADLSDIVAYQ